ncbi:MAG: fumarylacetoacetate hydrolase [Bdellovibrionaceae bacterium]|nr:fumarylacetoacetate hydrolase [Pseudobdellovibrionaceae bacterium]|tara:strand:- start:5454 stop:6503 length:1050 start_codon:yes stop_codon:yes gene_type:complete
MAQILKLVTYLNSEDRKKVGIKVEDEEHRAFVIDLKKAYEKLKEQSSENTYDLLSVNDMQTLIERKVHGLGIARAVLKAFEEKKISSELLLPESETLILAPLAPRSFRDAYAFRQHVEAGRKNRNLPMIPEYDEFPVFYFSNAFAVSGPGNLFLQKEVLGKLDYELEIAAVIDRDCQNLKAKDADSYIFGYMILNDWSARDLQMKEMTLNLGPAKGKDFATTIGPYLVPQEELLLASTQSDEGRRFDLKMTASINGVQKSEGNFKDIHWTFAQILERVSQGVHLRAGEIIGSGTVGTGCLLELNGALPEHERTWLKEGDEVSLSIEHLGTLKNTINLKETKTFEEENEN